MARDGERRGIATRFLGGRLTLQDVVLAILLVPALLLMLLPLLPAPGDHATLMKVWFRDAGTRVAHVFSLPEDESTCSAIALTMAEGNPASGAYTKVVCGTPRIDARRRDLVRPRHPGTT
jgi:hypothetical protein